MPRRRGETLVDLQHLLEDLRDAYPGALEETILTELIANALDAGATRLSIRADAGTATLTVVDDGRGMLWKELREFHNLATSTKVRGRGIGFAGVGVKLALLVCREVVTESRRGRSHTASRWHLASRNKAPYQHVPPRGLVSERGTAVCLVLDNALSPLLDAGYVEHALRTHFAPLLDPAFEAAMLDLYPRGIRFDLNGAVIAPTASEAPERALLEVRIGRRRKPSGYGYLERHPHPLPEASRGVAVSTFGKVIRQGWDWLGLFPTHADRIQGILEVPALSECLTLNKGDFVRTGVRGATFLGFRRAIQEVVQRQLADWGDAQDPAEQSRRRAARPVERDLERVLMDLANDFPLLASLVDQRAGGQRKLPFGGSGSSPRSLDRTSSSTAEEVTAALSDSSPPAGRASGQPAEPVATLLAEPEPRDAAGAGGAVGDPTAPSRPRRSRYGLAIEFEERPGDPEPGRLAESTVFVNAAHPAYRRAVLSRAEGYHMALAVAFALAPLAVDSANEHAFVTSFLSRWGEAVTAAPRRRR